MRLQVRPTGLRTYPDVTVYCGPVQYDSEDPENATTLNPTVVVEVVSSSTEAYDRGFKAENYRRVEPLQAYMLVAPDRPHVELHRRQPDGGWLTREAGALGEVIRIEPLYIGLPLVEMDDRIEFPAAPTPPLARQGRPAPHTSVAFHARVSTILCPPQAARSDARWP